MSDTAKKLFKRPGFIFLEVLFALALIVFLGISILVWRVAQSPLDLEFAKPTIQNALKNPENGIHARMQGVYLHWPDLKGPLLLALSDVEVLDSQNKTIVSVDEAALGLSGARLLIGQISPLALILKKPALNIKRSQDGISVGFNLSGPAAPVKEEQTGLTERIIEYIANPAAHAEDKSPLATLKQFKIENALLIIDDDVTGSTWSIPDFDTTLESTLDGLNAEFMVALSKKAGTEAGVEGRLTYNREKGEFRLDTLLKHMSTAFLAEKLPDLAILKDHDLVINAAITAEADETFTVNHLKAQVFSEKGQIALPGHYQRPLPYKNLDIGIDYDRTQKVLNIENVSATLNGVPIKVVAKLAHHDENFHNITGTASLIIDTLPQEKIPALWPNSLKEEAVTEWLTRKVYNGTYHDLILETGLSITKSEAGWNIQTPGLKGRFSFDNTDIAYLDDISPVTGASGSGTLDYDAETLVVNTTQGTLKNLQITEAEVKLEHIIEAGAGTASVNVKLNGPLRDVFSYIGEKRIGVDHGFDLNRVNGQADMNVGLFFPTLKDVKTKDVQMDITAQLKGVDLPDVTSGLDLKNGQYDLNIKDNKLRVAGKGELDTRPADIVYEQFIYSEGKPYKNKITVNMRGDLKLAEKLGADIGDYIAGDFPVNVVYTDFGGKADVDINANIQSAYLFFDPFKYKKAKGEPGTVSLIAKLNNGNLQEVRNLNIKTPDANVQGGQLVFGGKDVKSGNFPVFSIGKTQGKATLDVGAQGALKVTLNGSFLDARPFLENTDQDKQKHDEPPIELSVAVDRMQTEDDQSVRNVKIYAAIDDQGRFNQLELDAVAGSGMVYLRFKPDSSGRRMFRFEADDAGATLQAFGVYDKIKGGKIVIQGNPPSDIYDRNVTGKAELTNFTVVKAPVLARLLGALSLPGILQLLDGQGVQFAKLESDFDWVYRPDGSLLVLKNGRTSGNSMGLTFDGSFDNTKGLVDVSGTVIPLSEINKIIGNIPLIGDILTGGSGSVFAATYTVKGSTENPEVFVNPLSVLTPGILRRILFEN